MFYYLTSFNFVFPFSPQIACKQSVQVTHSESIQQGFKSKSHSKRWCFYYYHPEIIKNIAHMVIHLFDQSGCVKLVDIPLELVFNKEKFLLKFDNPDCVYVYV